MSFHEFGKFTDVVPDHWHGMLEVFDVLTILDVQEELFVLIGHGYLLQVSPELFGDAHKEIYHNLEEKP